MNILSLDQKAKFQIVYKQCMPEYMLRVTTGNIFADILVNDNADLYMPLYAYEEEICFIFGRLHFYINKWFEENRMRIEKGNFYLTSGSRAEINDIEKTVKQLQKFFDKLNYSLVLIDNYAQKIKEIQYFISHDSTGKFILSDNYMPITDMVVDEPLFRLNLKNSFRNAKYLVFGVSKYKPDIRMGQVLDGDLEIVNSDEMLVYDEEINDSLLYSDFTAWWSKNKNKYSWYDVKTQLQPKELLVQNFYKKHYEKEDNPILIPQVYLHYDPKNKDLRKKCKFNNQLIFQRMDFLIIYNGKRIIIEIDGPSHLLTDGSVDMKKYADQLEYDRTMKFLGYDIFRIANSELESDNAEKTLSIFFSNLYSYLGIVDNKTN